MRFTAHLHLLGLPLGRTGISITAVVFWSESDLTVGLGAIFLLVCVLLWPLPPACLVLISIPAHRSIQHSSLSTVQEVIDYPIN